MHTKLFFLIFCTVFVAGAASAQFTQPQVLHLYPAVPAKKKQVNFFSLNNTAFNNIHRQAPKPSVRIIAPNFYTAGFGFFCRQELKLEKITSIPFRFRLGSVISCDRLEGKRVSITQ